jgi:O-antigen/teichoic acid export membrane protein
VLLFANLVTIPFMIRLLGSSRYGLWALLSTSITWAMIADVGMASASTKFGAERYAHGDDRGESAVVWSALSVTGVSTSCVAILVAIEARFILEHLLKANAGLIAPGVVALRVVCAIFVAQSIAGTINTPQVVRLRWREYTLVNGSANLFASIGAPVALVLLSGGVVTVAVVGLASGVIAALGNLLLAVRAQPAVRRPSVDRATLRKLLAYGGALTVSGLASIPLTTAERFFLAHNHSTTVVAYYAVAATLGTTLYVLPGQLMQPLLPGLARLEAEGRFDEHRALYMKALGGLFVVLMPAAIMLMFLARPFLSLWAGRAYGLHGTGPFLVIMVGVLFNCLGWVPLSYLLSAGRTKVIAYVQTAEVVPYLVGAYLLTSRFGAVGAAAVWSARLVVQAVVLFAVVRRVAPQLPFSPLSERRARSVAAPLALGCAAIAAATVSQSLGARAVWVTGLGALYVAAVWRLVLTTRERRGLLSLVSQVAKRRASYRPHHAM